MMLLVDIGNTRVKWASWSAGGMTTQRAAEHAAWSVQDWQRELFAGAPVGRVLAATVAGPASKRALQAAAAASGVTEVDFVSSTASACGVTNAYPQPALLGVDRWMALIGAWHRQRSACCIVDIGTAATVDTIDGRGRHLGGFIVPGPRLMSAALRAGTSDLAAHAAQSPGGGGQLFADNTHDAIERGCRVALAALVDRSVAELQRQAGAAPQLIVTGGACGEVLPYVVSGSLCMPDLVLQGLAVVAQTVLEP
jgi:type III pantothenate kinase